MLSKKELPQSTSSYGFFSSQLNQSNKASWQLIYSGSSFTLLFNASSKLLLGLGDNRIYKQRFEAASPQWSIPLRDAIVVKQIAAGERHILILYENGLLDGYGYDPFGQLGIGGQFQPLQII